jgi:hypothetical protein
MNKDLMIKSKVSDTFNTRWLKLAGDSIQIYPMPEVKKKLNSITLISNSD